MKILFLADEESRILWDFFDKTKVEDVDLIISCGDLDPRYLSFLETMTSVPLLYVHGNHDRRYEKIPPEGCICIEDDIYAFQGLRILGLGGSMRYVGGAHQYTEEQMCRRIRHLRRKLRRNRGFDILVTHAPAFSINDSRDLPHQGFRCFVELIEKYSPSYFVHGHIHKTYGSDYKRLDRYRQTTIINAYGHCILDTSTGELSR